MTGQSWVVTAGSAEEAVAAVHRSVSVGRNAHAGRVPGVWGLHQTGAWTRPVIPQGPAHPGAPRGTFTRPVFPHGPAMAGAVAGPFSQAELQAMLPQIHSYLRATAQQPWHQTKIAGTQAGQFDSGWSTLQLVLAGLLGFGAGLFGGWILANMMQLGTALAPAAATALKAAPLAAL